MLATELHNWLSWPAPEAVAAPRGAGARVALEHVQRKLQMPLKQQFPELKIETTPLIAAPHSEGTVQPLAVICQFSREARDEALAEAHRLAWNLSQTSLLITLEPHRLIAWSCQIDPLQTEDRRRVCELPIAPGFSTQGSAMQRSVRDLLHWVSLTTGHLQRQRAEYFPDDGRADALLLKNLRYVRTRLIESDGLDQSFCHDLLARVIFTQYLFHRRDSGGRAFFSPELLRRLGNGPLRAVHSDLESVLRDHGETYALFRWLDERFNGDLFPGKEAATADEREAAWQAERKAVTPEHLHLLADLVSGRIDTTDGQLKLWPEYSFDTIPLEFISSIYETFLSTEKKSDKAYYTPPHLVDYVLDAVLPWDGTDWNLRILDPACGSGIFLVKALQRLIHRWRRTHLGREPLVSDLKPILANNLVGVDKNPEAVRVACFSLYLAMADAIEPRHYVTREKIFPRLRGTRLIASDFFDEATTGFCTPPQADPFDLVVGNAPWGDKSVKVTSVHATPRLTIGTRPPKQPLTLAEEWAKTHRWPIANHDIGPLFVSKSLDLVRAGSAVAMVQPAGPWLYHRGEPAREIRQRLFDEFTVEEITNLSLVRRELFPEAVGPACVLVARRQPRSPTAVISYIVPKPTKNANATRRGASPSTALTIEPQDVARISHDEAARDPFVWSVLALGGRRDLELIRNLSRLPTLSKLKATGQVLTRNGVIPGDQQRRVQELAEVPYIETETFPTGTLLWLDVAASRLPLWGERRVHSKESTSYEAFKRPQLLIKQSLSAKTQRLAAALVKSPDPTWGVICKETYLTVRDLTEDQRNIRAACMVLNSRLASYYLALTSSRMHYRVEALTHELLDIPLPEAGETSAVTFDLSGVRSPVDIDRQVQERFALTEAEWTLIEDLHELTLPELLRKTPGPGRSKTVRDGKGESEPELSQYVATVARVLSATFGNDKQIDATIYQEPATDPRETLPVRMVTLSFDPAEATSSALNVERITADGLLDRLSTLHRELLTSGRSAGSQPGLAFGRVAFLFHTHSSERGRVRSLTIIKPDERRYWSRSQAMRDADEIAAVILRVAGRRGGAVY